MRDYFTHAAQARRIARKVITRCLDSELPLGLGLASIGRVLSVADPDAAGRDPALPLHVAELAQAYGLAVSGDLEEDIAALSGRPSGAGRPRAGGPRLRPPADGAGGAWPTRWTGWKSWARWPGCCPSSAR